MKCSDVYRYICANLDENLDSARCRQIKRHIAECPDCSAYLDSLRKTIFLYRTYPTPTIPRSVHKRLFKVIRTVESEGTESKKSKPRAKVRAKK